MFFQPFLPPVPPEFPDRVFDIRSFGAVPDGKTLCTEAIRAAVSACSASGGGRVLISGGTYLTGPIHFADNVDLHVDEGAVVRFSRTFEEYLPPVYGILAGIRCFCPSHFLYARDCRNIALTGTGTLDGQGDAWWDMRFHKVGMYDLVQAGREHRPLEGRVYDKREQGVRPRMLQFVGCENVLIEDVTLINSPSWTVHPAWCRNLTVRRLHIVNPPDAPNTDGVNLDSCRRALVEHCVVDTGDDAFCLKAGRDEDAWEVGIPCEDVEIRYCRALHGHGGVTVGSETSAGIRNAWIHDCTFGSMYSGVRIKTMQGRGGVVENLDFARISVENARDGALYATMRYTGESLDDHSKPVAHMPIVRNIAVAGLTCDTADTAIRLTGEVGYPLRGFALSDIRVCHAEHALCTENVKELSMERIVIG